MFSIKVPSSKENVYISEHQFKNLSHCINFKTLFKYITPDSIDKEFIKVIQDKVKRKDPGLYEKFIMKSTNLDVIKICNNLSKITIHNKFSMKDEISEEFISYYKDKITSFTFLNYLKCDISENLFKELYPYIVNNDYTFARMRENIIFNQMAFNGNISEEFIRENRCDILEEMCKEYDRKSYLSSKNFFTFNFLKVYRDIIDWEFILLKAPLKLFNEKFVKEFYKEIGPLCISMSDLDTKKLKLISKYYNK